MIFEIFVQAVADTFGATLTNAGMMMSLFFTIMLLLLVLVTAKRKPEMPALVTSLFSTILFLVMGWYPVWLGSVIALALALFAGWYISKMGGK